MFDIKQTFLAVVPLLVLTVTATIELALESEPLDEAELIFAHIMFRHGDRNILNDYRNDPWKDDSYWPEGYGQLTTVGKQQQYELGKYLRSRYKSLIDKASGENVNDIVYAQSTDVDRTLMSAASNLAGLFPPDDGQIWNSNLSWQPIPIHTTPLKMDYILCPSIFCPRYTELFNEYRNSSETFREITKKYKHLHRYLEKHSGKEINCLNDIWTLYDTLSVEHLKNKTLPEWTKDVFMPGCDMEFIVIKLLVQGTETSQMARLRFGFYLRELLERFTQKIESTLKPDRSLWIHSVHDTTIAGVLNTLGLFEPHQPPYCATILFELYKLKDQFYIKLFYKNTSDGDPLQLNFPSCGPMCSIDRFYEIYKEIIPTKSIEEECRLPSTIFKYEFNLFNNDVEPVFTFQFICLFIGMLFMIAILWRFLQQRAYNASKIFDTSITFYNAENNQRLTSVCSEKMK